jgi:hypothetical protein
MREPYQRCALLRQKGSVGAHAYFEVLGISEVESLFVRDSIRE